MRWVFLVPMAMALYAGVRGGTALWRRKPLAVSVRGLTLFFAMPVLFLTFGSLWLAGIQSAPASGKGFLWVAAGVSAVFVLVVARMGRGVYVAGMGREAFLASLSKVLSQRGLAHEITAAGASIANAPDLCLQFFPEHALVLMNTAGSRDARFLRGLVRDLGRGWTRGAGERGSLPMFLGLALSLLVLTGWWAHERLPRGPGFWVDLGQGFVSAKRFPDAVAALDRAVAMDPENAPARTWRGTARFMANDLPGAALDLEKGLALAPESADAALHLSRFLAGVADDRFRNPKRALSLAESAAKKAPDSPLAADTLALARAANHDLPGAVQAQEKALELLKKANAAEEVIEEGKKRLEDYRAGKNSASTP